MMDIAAKCGTSLCTVSNALRGGNGEVSEETRKRVVAVADEMGYDPSQNLSARRMAMQRRGTLPRNHSIAFALPHGHSEATFYLRILLAVMNTVTEHSYGLHLTTSPDTSAPLSSVLTSGEVDGMLTIQGSVWGPLFVDRIRTEPNFGDRPIVSLVDPIPGCSSVHADYFSAAYQAASHLLDLGHRGIIHNFDPQSRLATLFPSVVFTGTDAVNRRLLGISQACRDRGLDPDQTLFLLPLPHHVGEIDEYGPALLAFLKENPAITAIIAQNDYSAVPVWQTLIRAGLRVPEDISLIGFDDTDPIYSPTGYNILTTVRIPLTEIAVEATKLLIRTIDGDVQNLQEIVLPTELIVRGSTTHPRSV
jgi:DNA-binding LacI/PurR family transcriptional regulator